MTDVLCAKWKKQCPLSWEDLEPIPTSPIRRFCSNCQQEVHRVEYQHLYDQLAAQGKCVALVKDDGPLEMGLPMTPGFFDP